MTAILYSFRRCPYAMRGRMALHASGADYEHREVLLRDKPQAMLDVSSKGTVPVFITNDNNVIDESLDVMHWALGNNDPKGWLDCDLEGATTLIATNDGPFKHHLDRYKYASRFKDDAKRGDVDRSHRKAAEAYLQTLEEHLADSEYLLGKKQTIVDIAIFPFIRQFANTDRDWWNNNAYPRLREWLDRHVNSDIFKIIMKKHPQWAPTQAAIRPHNL